MAGKKVYLSRHTHSCTKLCSVYDITQGKLEEGQEIAVKRLSVTS
jgi:hypothetical protein